MPDEESLPKTEPYTPTFDTGSHPQPFEPLAAQPEPSAPDSSTPELKEPDSPAASAPPEADSATAEAPPSEPIPAPAPSVTVPGRYYYVKWWQFILMIAAVWIPAAAIGPGLFYWWTQDHSLHKTSVVFVVLIYVLVCTVGGLMLAMVPDRPLVSALAVAVMSAVFASVAAAAPFYGAFYCDHTVGRCLMGIIPY